MCGPFNTLSSCQIHLFMIDKMEVYVFFIYITNKCTISITAVHTCYKFERAEHFRCLGVILNDDNNHQIGLQERIKNANKTYFMLLFFRK
jgi:hypothetical protein